MKNLLIFFISLGLVLAFSTLAKAEIKIGVVDLFKILNESEKGKKAIGELQSMVDSRHKALEEKQKKIRALREEYDKRKAVLSEDARKAREDEIERLERDFQRTAADYQAEVQKKENEITRSMLREIRQIINEYAAKEGYNLIIEKAEQLILYSKPEVDITDKIITLYNQKTSTQKGGK